MALSIGGAIYVSIKPLIKIFLNCAIGFYLARQNILSVEVVQSLSVVIINVLMPALIFNKVIESISGSDIALIGVFCLTMILYLSLGLTFSFITKLCTPSPKYWTGGLIVAGTMTNIGDLPIAYVTTLASGTLFSTKDGSRGTAYSIIFLTVFIFAFFNLGAFRLLERDFTNKIKDIEANVYIKDEIPEPGLKHLIHLFKTKVLKKNKKNSDTSQSPSKDKPTGNNGEDNQNTDKISKQKSLNFETDKKVKAETPDPIKGIDSKIENESDPNEMSTGLASSSNRAHTEASNRAARFSSLVDVHEIGNEANHETQRQLRQLRPFRTTESMSTMSDAFSSLSNMSNDSLDSLRIPVTKNQTNTLKRYSTNASTRNKFVPGIGVVPTDPFFENEEEEEEKIEPEKIDQVINAYSQADRIQRALTTHEPTRQKDIAPSTSGPIERVPSSLSIKSLKKKAFAAKVWCYKHKLGFFWEFFINFLRPPSVALIIAITFTMIPWVRRLFYIPENGSVKLPDAPDGQPALSFVMDITGFVGNCEVPLGLMTLGATIARLRLTSLPKGFWKNVAMLTVFKLGVLPIIAIVWTEKMRSLGWIDKDNRIAVFVMIISSGLPSATSQVYLTAIYTPTDSDDHEEMDCFAAHLIAQYSFLVISMTILLTYTLKNVLEF